MIVETIMVIVEQDFTSKSYDNDGNGNGIEGDGNNVCNNYDGNHAGDECEDGADDDDDDDDDDVDDDDNGGMMTAIFRYGEGPEN